MKINTVTTDYRSVIDLQRFAKPSSQVMDNLLHLHKIMAWNGITHTIDNFKGILWYSWSAVEVGAWMNDNIPQKIMRYNDTEPMDGTTLSSDQSDLLIRYSELTSSTPKPFTANDMNNTNRRSPRVAQGDGNAGSKNDAAD